MSKLSDRILYNEPLNKRASADLGAHSITRNIQHILNTRSSIGIKKFLSEGTILDNLTFGLPDFSFLSIASKTDMQTLCDVIQKSIISFEPRLSGVVVELGKYDPMKREILVKVSANFYRDNIIVNFLLNLNRQEFNIDEREHK